MALNGNSARTQIARSAQAASKPISTSISTDTSIARLIRYYWVWKALLLTIAAVSPGPGYDTSTEVLLDRYPSYSDAWLAEAARWLAAKLTRWDAIYFTNTAARGLVFEQEWAFSPVLSKVTSVLARVFPYSLCGSQVVCNAWAGIVTSHLSHLGAVLALFALTYRLIPASDHRRRQIAFTTACLHIISPGGLFLSAHYGESAFACLNFCGMLLLVAPQHNSKSDIFWAFNTVAGGLAFGLASVVRSNGIFSGIILAWDAVAYLPSLPSMLKQKRWIYLMHLVVILVSGSLILHCQILLQGQAYVQYCTNDNWRPWCGWLPPSIYTWVQQHYWGVGFLRYWTVSNLPLFALAIPMMAILSGTGIVALQRTQLTSMLQDAVSEDKGAGKNGSSSIEAQERFASLMARFALPQVVLTVLALTSFHVQIINRISSGYPVWYVVLAIAIHAEKAPQSRKEYGFFLGWLTQHSTWIIQAMVMYAIVQGGLYATFMPPA